MSVKPKCYKIDCFQNKVGARCELLTDSPSQPCPFYKTEEQNEKDKEKAHQRLVAEGRTDLIEEYEHNPQRRGQW